MIFVSTDESGRGTKGNVREGDAVKKRRYEFYSVDDDLQQGDSTEQASLQTAQQTRPRLRP